MSKCNEVGGRGSADAAVGFMGRRVWASRHSKVPQTSSGNSMALKDHGVIVPDGGVCGGESDMAASITQLSNRTEWDARSGTIWTFWAAAGRPVTSSSAS
jgi:adhesin HecA-like repeat protein